MFKREPPEGCEKVKVFEEGMWVYWFFWIKALISGLNSIIYQGGGNKAHVPKWENSSQFLGT